MRNTLDHFKNLLRTGQSAAAHDIKRAVSRMQRDDRCIRRLIDRCGWYEQEIKRLKAPKEGWEQYAKRNGHPVTPEPTEGAEVNGDGV